ncbi:MAG: ergothioneine biosynthesis protein EgtB [Thermoplasmatota archaeon]
MTDKDALHAHLEDARTRTWLLADGLDDDALATPATDYLSPPVWDLGHIANFEELWLVQKILECEELHDGFNDTYDAFKHGRAERPKLRLLDRQGARTYMEEVRARARKILDATDLSACQSFVQDGFVHTMIALHEEQHQETLLQSIAMRGADGQYKLPQVRKLPDPEPTADAWCHVEAGPFLMGTNERVGVYDNERPQHERDVPAFDIAKYPVTTGAFLEFLTSGGYNDPDLWSQRGRAWLAETDHHAPLYWRQIDGAWHRVGPGCQVPIERHPDEILCNVSYFEAEAFAAWSDARLPTEAEWERAAQGVPDATASNANIDQLAFTTSRIGAYATESTAGCSHMLGDVWEWTSSGFEAYPGFEAFPYPEYSEVFFGGDYRVLRGGSWATRAGCATTTFRNWDHPYRRQIMSGIRLARTA